MRKYRGKRVDNGEWVYGSLLFVPYTGMTYIFPDDARIVKLSEIIQVDPKTVGQSTGRKDRNGRELFECDIFENWFNGKRYKIVYGTDAAFYGESTPHGGNEVGGRQTVSLNNASECAVRVGNIHDNPELAEVGA